MSKKNAIIVVDVQNDFCDPNGALSVPNAPEILSSISELIQSCVSHGDIFVFSQDSHPKDHCSFTENGGVWPTHCVVETWGYDLYPEIEDIMVNLPGDRIYRIHKANDPNVDAYSAFDGTGLGDALRAEGVSQVIICGLATDFCVKATAIDAVNEGFSAVVHLPSVRGVFHDSTQKAIIDMINAGVVFATI